MEGEVLKEKIEVFEEKPEREKRKVDLKEDKREEDRF